MKSIDTALRSFLTILLAETTVKELAAAGFDIKPWMHRFR